MAGYMKEETGSRINEALKEEKDDLNSLASIVDHTVPFVAFEKAAWMRDTLMLQSPHVFQVELFDKDEPSKGFVVSKVLKEVALEEESSQVMENQIQDSIAIKIYHPALRTYCLHIPLLLAGFVLVFFAVELWSLILSLAGLRGLPSAINPVFLVNTTKFMGSIWILWLMAGVLLNYYGTRLIIDHRGITFNRGIWTRDETNVRFSEIRTINLRQGLLDCLLNIGILEFASSGTDEVDIRFINMPGPGKVKADIEALIERSRERY